MAVGCVPPGRPTTLGYDRRTSTTWKTSSLGYGCGMCDMWQDSSSQIWPSYVHNVAHLHPSYLSVVCELRGRSPTLRYGCHMCTMWKASNTQIWSSDVHHVVGLLSSDMAIYYALRGRPPALGFGPWMCSDRIWVSDVCHMAGLQLFDLASRYVPRGRRPVLESDHLMYVCHVAHILYSNFCWIVCTFYIHLCTM
jgi:hypothetical protein